MEVEFEVEALDKVVGLDVVGFADFAEDNALDDFFGGLVSIAHAGTCSRHITTNSKVAVKCLTL